jgi:hypothetical protein
VQTNDTGDVLYRIMGGVMLLSAAWNVLVAFVMFLSLIIVFVGVLWIIPGLLALLYGAVGVFAIVTGRKFRLIGFAPIFGLVISVLNFNVFGGLLDVVALVLGVVGFVVSNQGGASAQNG